MTHPVSAYLLGVSIENYRCFGKAQYLNLSTADGKPAQWTLILGAVQRQIA